MVEQVVEVIERDAPFKAGFERPGSLVGGIEAGGKTAEQLGIGQLGFAVAVVDGRVDQRPDRPGRG